MTYIRSLQIIVLLFVLNVVSLATLHNQASVAGQVTGTVIDLNDARVAGANITVEGEGLTRTTVTAEDGTYRLELPAGTFRIRVARTGFCPASRAPFRTVESTSIIFNFTMIPCSLVNELKMEKGKYAGERDRYKDPFKEEAIPVAGARTPALDLLVRYGSRQEDGTKIEYKGAVVSYDSFSGPTGSARVDKYLGASISYDSLMIRADKVVVDRNSLRIEAEGNVVVEDGKQRRCGKRAEVRFESGAPIVKLD
jgi:hypothetical protein